MPSELLKHQWDFAYKIGLLFVWIREELGLMYTLGEGYDDDNTGHMKGSMHYIKMAQDINLFKEDGTYLGNGAEAEAAHNKIHDKWDTMGGAPRIGKDLNHYSFMWEGRR